MKKLIAFVAVLACTGYASAETIDINNASFEAPVLDPGGWTNDFLAKDGLHSGNPVLAAAPGIKESMLNLFRAAGH